MMTNKINDETLQRLYEDVVADDEAGLIDDVISNVAYLYGLHEDDDRDEILQFIAEQEFYEQFT
jgi:rRNA processing protein Gar1